MRTAQDVPAGRAADMLVAKLLGWRWNDESAFEPGGGMWSRHSDAWLAYFSTDMAAAWQLVESLKTPDVFCELYSGVPDPANRYHPEPVWTCRFVRDGQLLGYGSAPEPPLAICRAVIAWQGASA